MNPEDLSNKFNNLPDAFYKVLIDSIESGVYLVDQDQRIVHWNKAARRLSGYTAEEVMGNSCGDGFLDHVDFDGRLLCEENCPLKSTMADGETYTMDVFMKHKDGHRVPVRVTANPVFDHDGVCIGAVETFHDITPDLVSRKQIQELSEVAFTDPMTGLTNRRAAERVIGDACALWKRDKISFGLLFVDIDNLKQINDQFGHSTGDAAIQAVAKTMQSLFRRDDVISRWGGDEFVVLVRNVDQKILDKAEHKVKMGIRVTELPKEFPNGKLSISVGSTLVREGDTLETFVSRADQRMYQEKQRKSSE